MNNTTFKLEAIHQLGQQEFSNVTETEWKNCERHAIKQFENGRWKNDGLYKKVQPVIINIDDSSDDDGDENDEDDEDDSDISLDATEAYSFSKDSD